MKKIGLIFIAILCNSFCDAQGREYVPFIEESKHWTVAYSALWFIHRMEDYYIDGDTIVDSRPYKKLMCRSVDYMEDKDTTFLYFFVFEENRRVYYCPVTSATGHTPIILYDFSATTGDTLSLGGQLSDRDEMVCYKIWKSLTYEGDAESVFHGQLATSADIDSFDVDEDFYTPIFKWYECVGSFLHPFVKIGDNREWSGQSCWLYECRINDRLIYSNNRNMSVAGIVTPTNSTVVFTREKFICRT